MVLSESKCTKNNLGIIIMYLMSCTEIYVRLCLMSANDDVYAYQQSELFR